MDRREGVGVRIERVRVQRVRLVVLKTRELLKFDVVWVSQQGAA
jgi:hypothetical protein